ncbi:MAG TPA: hypothetical protein VFJ14_01765 [Nocardioidaceae bacterium]|nr:hypothetical protein [Nocardioidaceae bacterium]
MTVHTCVICGRTVPDHWSAPSPVGRICGTCAQAAPDPEAAVAVLTGRRLRPAKRPAKRPRRAHQRLDNKEANREA